jgi:hypothetical protein
MSFETFLFAILGLIIGYYVVAHFFVSGGSPA